MSKILGVSAFFHDSAAVLIIDGEIISAAQEERFTRKKHDPDYPENAINYVLSEAEIFLDEIDYVVFYEKPFLKFERLLETYLAFAPRGLNSFRMALPIWLREKLFLKDMLLKRFRKLDQDFSYEKIKFSEHHFSHAASAFYASPFEEAVVLTIDGVGEWATTTVAIGKGNKLEIIKEIHFPHSLGLLYSAFTYYIGFRVNSGEYKLMGLAPYGEPKYKDLILENLIDLKEDGSFRLYQEYFNYSAGLTMTNNKFAKLFGHSVRKPDVEELTQFHMDIASSIQKVTEEIVLRIVKSISNEFNKKNLCLAGGVSLNCVANGKILKSGYFDNLWIQPAAGDAGGALGAALAFYYHELSNKRHVNNNDSMKGAFLGPSYSNDEIEKELDLIGAIYSKYSRDEVINKTTALLEGGKAIGWFQGRMEFGPRALGARSIIGDPRSEQMQKNLNLKVKFRESFRPFAPSILADDVSEWFEIDRPSPYMLLVANVAHSIKREMSDSEDKLFGIEKLNVVRSKIPSVTHVDYSARVQTVHYETNPRYYDLLKSFKNKTGCPVLINTSFNVRGEPIVASPVDAFKCFMGTNLDALVINDFILIKKNQKESLKEDYRNKYKLD